MTDYPNRATEEHDIEQERMREEFPKEPDFIETLQHVFGSANVFVIDESSFPPMPDDEELDSDDYKILFMLLCENRSNLELDKGLTEHGKRLLHNVQRKIGINAVGVDMDAK